MLSGATSLNVIEQGVPCTGVFVAIVVAVGPPGVCVGCGVFVVVAIVVLVAVDRTCVGVTVGGAGVSPSYRASAKLSKMLNVSLTPAATILPSGCIATAYTLSTAPPKSVVSLPSPLKVVSRLPLVL